MQISLENVSFAYGETQVVYNASLLINSGEWVRVVYKSGEGGSTISKLAAGLLKPSSGSVKLSEKEPNPQNLNVTLLPKNPVLFLKKSVQKNLEYVDKVRGEKTNQAKILNLLNQYKLNPKIKAKKLNAKERLLVSLARAEYANKKVIIADDIFLPLSRAQMSEVMPYFLRVCKGKTVLFLDSTNVNFSKFKNYVLVYGSLYSVPQNAQDAVVFSSYLLSEKNPKYFKEEIKIENNKKYFKINSNNYYLNKIQQKIIENNKAEQVLVCKLGKNNKYLVYDAENEQRLFDFSL